MPVILRLYLCWRQGHEAVCHVGQEWDGNSKVVAIGFHKVMASDGCGVYVMLTEWANEGLHV